MIAARFQPCAENTFSSSGVIPAQFSESIVDVIHDFLLFRSIPGRQVRKPAGKLLLVFYGPSQKKNSQS
jgi:hypothetical protein